MSTQTLQKWDRVKLGDIAEIESGGTPSSSKPEYWDDGDICWATLPDLKNKYLFDTERKITSLGLKNSSAKLLPVNSVIFSSRATIGEVAIAKVETSTNQGSKNFICDPAKIDYEFLYYLLKSKVEEIINLASGATYKEINKTVFSSVEVDIPNIPIQKQIAQRLAVYDDLIYNNTRRIQILEQTAQAVYAEWFVNFRFPDYEKIKMVDSDTDFRKIPEGWSVLKIGDVCTRIQAGGTPRRGKDEYWNNGTISWYTTGELQDNFLFGSKEKITEQSIDETSAKIFDKGTILMAIYGSPTVGRLGIITERSSCNQAALGLVEDTEKITKTYLYYVLKNLREKFNLEAVGAAQQNISKIKVSETQCLVANRDLINQFDVIAFPIFQELESLQRQNDVLRQTRDLLLPKLVTGKIRV